jgi:hypothetical protein
MFLSTVMGSDIKINGDSLVEKANPSFPALSVSVSKDLLPKLSETRRGVIK